MIADHFVPPVNRLCKKKKSVEKQKTDFNEAEIKIEICQGKSTAVARTK